MPRRIRTPTETYRSTVERNARARVRLTSPASSVVPANAVETLVAMGLLAKDGLEVAWPGDGTAEAAWRHIEPMVIPTATIGDFERYRWVKRQFGAASQPPSRAAIQAVVAYFKGRVPSVGAIGALLGARPLKEDIVGLQASRCGSPRAGRILRASLTDLLECFPMSARRRLRATLEREVLPEVRPPAPTHMGRALALKGGAARLYLAGLLLLRSSERRSHRYAASLVQMVEMFDRLIPGEAQCDAAAVGVGLDLCLGPGRQMYEGHLIRLYHWQLDAVAAFLREALGGDADEIVARLPASHPRRADFQRSVNRLTDRYYREAKQRKDEHIKGLVPKLDALMSASDNRVVQLQGIFLVWVEALAAAQEVDADDVTVLSEGPVVRPDGSLGIGRQIVRFRLVHEDLIFADACRKSPEHTMITDLARCRRKDPPTHSRMHLVYVSSSPATPGGECHEPYFVDMLRFGIFDSGAGLTADQGAGRRTMLEALGLPPLLPHRRGLLNGSAPERKTAEVLRSVLGPEAPVIVPLLNLVHAMTIACIVIRMGVRWGARIGETRQLRMGCFSNDCLDGEGRILANLRPKGWAFEAPYEIDEATAFLIQRVKDLARARWWPEEHDERGQPALPISPFRDASRPDMGPARYILVGAEGLVRHEDLLLFIKVLLAGVAEASSHDLRYLFVTILGVQGFARKDIAREIHHARHSSRTKCYDKSDDVLRNGLLPSDWHAIAGDLLDMPT